MPLVCAVSQQSAARRRGRFVPLREVDARGAACGHPLRQRGSLRAAPVPVVLAELNARPPGQRGPGFVLWLTKRIRVVDSQPRTGSDTRCGPDSGTQVEISKA